jgi:hypothetical protein
MGIEVNGTTLDSLVWNIRFLGDRMATAGRRGANLETAGLDGARWRADKPLAELAVNLSMWLVGSNTDGTLPGNPTLKAAMRTRYDQLLRLMGQAEQLVEVRDTETGRRCFAEIQAALTPATMAGGSRAEVVFPLVIPAGCWEDTTAFATTPVVFGASTAVTVTGAGGGTLPLTGMTIKLTPPGRNIRITTASGKWVQFNGDLPAGADTWLVLNPENPACYKVTAPTVSLLAALDLPDVIPLPIPASTADPVLTVTAEATSAASRIAFTGRRRWASA